MKTLTVAFITSRHEPRVEWFLDSLAIQADPGTQVIIIDPYRPEGRNSNVRIAHPKPTVWQGPHRLTKADWWAASNSRNTAICLCETEWIAFVDDRSVLKPTWVEAVRAAMADWYVVCGPYEKVHNLQVSGPRVVGLSRPEYDFTWDGKKTDGKDSRVQYIEDHYLQHKHLCNPYEAPGEWTYGCSLALPLEWALQVNGFDESFDGASGEDYIFGLTLKNNGFPIKFDLRMGMIEDRTPGHLGPTIIRQDKGVSPNDRSHWLLNKHRTQRRSQHQWDLRQVRAAAITGHGFPVPSWPNRDPYDGQPLSEMTPC